MNNRGISSFSNQSTEQTKFQNLGQQLLLRQHEELDTQLQVFQNALITFKEQYKDEIIKNPKFRTEFSEICLSFGIDPLIVSTSTSKDGDSGGDDAEDKYNHLAIKIFELCRMTKNLNGGIVSTNEMVNLIKKENENSVLESSSLVVKESDVIKSIDNLSKLGNELKLIKIGSKNYIKSIPTDISNDQSLILSTCDLLGFVSTNLLRDNFNWKRIRCTQNLEELISNGLIWIDDQPDEGTETLYWATSWINKEND